MGEAKEFYMKALDICLFIFEKNSSVESYADLANSYYHLATVDVDNFKKYIQKAIEIYEMLFQNHNITPKYEKRLKFLKTLLK